MSYYIQNDGVLGAQIASNSGWGEFGRWVESLNKYAQASSLYVDGYSDDPASLASQLKLIQKSETPPNSDVGDVLAGLVESVRARTVVSVTNGIG